MSALLNDEQELQLAEELGGAIRYHMEDVIQNCLNKGVNLNYRTKTNSPAIFSAIYYSNSHARKEFLKRKIDLNIMDVNRITPLHAAIGVGDEEAIMDLIQNGADVSTYCGANLLEPALMDISDYSLLHHGDWGVEDPRKGKSDPKLKQELMDFFFQRGAYVEKDDACIPFSKKGPFHVYYTGKLDIVGLLLSRNISPSMPAVGTDRSAKNIVKNPIKFVNCFTGRDIEFINSEENGQVLNFKLQFKNRCCEEPIDVIVHYDLQYIKQAIEHYLEEHIKAEDQVPSLAAAIDNKMKDAASENLKHVQEINTKLEVVTKDLKDHKQEIYDAHVVAYEANFRAQNAQQQTQRVEQKLVSERVRQEAHNQAINDFLNQKLGKDIEVRIKELVGNTRSEKCFNILQTHIESYFEVSKILSTGGVLRARNSKLDYLSSFLGLGNLLPTPFNLPFKVMKGLTDKAADATELARYKSITHLLPSDKSLQVYCRELSCVITEMVVKRLSELRTDALERLTLEDMENIAKLAFGVIAYTVYNVSTLGIDPKMTAELRTAQLTHKIFDTVSKERLLLELLEKSVKNSKTPPQSPVVQMKIAPPLPPKPPVTFSLGARKDEKETGVFSKVTAALEDKMKKAAIKSYSA